MVSNFTVLFLTCTNSICGTFSRDGLQGRKGDYFFFLLSFSLFVLDWPRNALVDFCMPTVALLRSMICQCTQYVYLIL